MSGRAWPRARMPDARCQMPMQVNTIFSAPRSAAGERTHVQATDPVGSGREAVLPAVAQGKRIAAAGESGRVAARLAPPPERTAAAASPSCRSSTQRCTRRIRMARNTSRCLSTSASQ